MCLEGTAVAGTPSQDMTWREGQGCPRNKPPFGLSPYNFPHSSLGTCYYSMHPTYMALLG